MFVVKRMPSVHLTLVGVIVAIAFCHATSASAKKIAGYVEKVWIFPGRITIHAKLDTGAKTSSLNAAEIETFRKMSEDWVRFTIEGRTGRRITIERPVVRTVKIKRHFDKQQKRPVVELDICLDNLIKRTEVNLVDRSGFNYQMLIGRRFLKGEFLVDPASSFQLQPSCGIKHD
jgi:hypothetical protein